MRMHPKPMQHHARTTEEMELAVSWNDKHPQPVHVVFTFGKATQRLTMDKDEAKELYENLATVLKYQDTPADAVNMSEWSRFFATIRSAIKEK